VRKAKATLHWGVDDPHEFERHGLTLVSDLDAGHWATPEVMARLKPGIRWQLKAVKLFPRLAKMARIGRWRF
jgi:hypothetical protein